jgi:hypothetical protein
VEWLFMDVLQRFTGQGRKDKKTANNYAPTAFAEEPEAKKQKFRRDDFAEAMRRLFATDKIMVEIYGRNARPSSKLVVKASKLRAVSRNISTALCSSPSSSATVSQPSTTAMRHCSIGRAASAPPWLISIVVSVTFSLRLLC